MANLKENIGIQRYSCPHKVHIPSKSGRWVKFDDIKELLNTSTTQSTPCSRCGKLNDIHASYCQWCGFTGRE